MKELNGMAWIARIISLKEPKIVSCGWFDSMPYEILRMKSSTAERKLRMLREQYIFSESIENSCPGYIYLPSTKQWRFYSHFVKWCGRYAKECS